MKRARRLICGLALSATTAGITLAQGVPVNDALRTLRAGTLAVLQGRIVDEAEAGNDTRTDIATLHRDQLAEIAGGMSVPEGETTMRHLRSASWYGNQVHEQLKTISNRTEFLSEEVESHRREAAKARHQHSRAAERSEADDQARQLAREARFDALMPPMRRR